MKEHLRETVFHRDDQFLFSYGVIRSRVMQWQDGKLAGSAEVSGNRIDSLVRNYGIVCHADGGRCG